MIIFNRYADKVILEVSGNLQDADLRGANLQDADLRGANLQDADLQGANLQDADLQGANLQDTDLQGANLRGAELQGADLQNANLRDANLQGADLRDANLQSASLQWNSHDLIAEILRQAADDDVDKLKIAGFILVSRGKCWRGFSAMVDPLKDWALDTLAALVLDNNGAP